MKLPDKVVGDWVDKSPAVFDIDSARVNLMGEQLKMTRVAYYGLINHIHNQLTWLIKEFVSKSRGQGRLWNIVFTLDHGEMLGVHHYF